MGKGGEGRRGGWIEGETDEEENAFERGNSHHRLGLEDKYRVDGWRGDAGRGMKDERKD